MCEKESVCVRDVCEKSRGKKNITAHCTGEVTRMTTNECEFLATALRVYMSTCCMVAWYVRLSRNVHTKIRDFLPSLYERGCLGRVVLTCAGMHSNTTTTSSNDIFCSAGATPAREMNCANCKCYM